jgi:copper(I)-binding protein
MNLKRPLKEGEVINLKLTFAKSGDVEVPFDVKSLAASSPQGKAKHQ